VKTGREAQRRRRRPIARSLVIFVALKLLSSARSIAADDQQPVMSVTPDAAWTAVFDRTDGWTGADCAGSVDLGDGRTLWMFGDTWLGKIRDGKRQPGATMVNNSIAVHPTEKFAAWRPPDPRAVQFVWGPNDKKGKPAAWAVPPPIAGDAASAEDWLWCNGGGVVGLGPDGKGRRLVVFFFRVRHNPHGQGVWAFTTVGTCFAVIDNVADPPERWRSKFYDLRHAPVGASHDEREVLWGLSVSRERNASGDEGRLRIFGTLRKGRFETSLVLARAKFASIDRLDFEFFDGMAWRPNCEACAKPLAGGLVSEFSVEEMNNAGKPTWVLIQSEPFLGKRIFARTAPKPEGPWSPRRTIYTVPDVAASRAYFTYAAKGHAALSRPGELVVTYLVNSQNFADVVRDTTIYHPKFLRVPLSAILGH
jgi:Domain of unknown function (DUF4185)